MHVIFLYIILSKKNCYVDCSEGFVSTLSESRNFRNILNDLDKLPKQTMKRKAEGNKGERRSINIPAINTEGLVILSCQEWRSYDTTSKPK